MLIFVLLFVILFSLLGHNYYVFAQSRQDLYVYKAISDCRSLAIRVTQESIFLSADPENPALQAQVQRSVEHIDLLMIGFQEGNDGLKLSPLKESEVEGLT